MTAEGLVEALEECAFKRGARLMTPHVVGHFAGWRLLKEDSERGLPGLLKDGTTNTAKFRPASLSAAASDAAAGRQ